MGEVDLDRNVYLMVNKIKQTVRIADVTDELRQIDENMYAGYHKWLTAQIKSKAGEPAMLGSKRLGELKGLLRKTDGYFQLMPKLTTEGEDSNPSNSGVFDYVVRKALSSPFITVVHREQLLRALIKLARFPVHASNLTQDPGQPLEVKTRVVKTEVKPEVKTEVVKTEVKPEVKTKVVETEVETEFAAWQERLDRFMQKCKELGLSDEQIRFGMTMQYEARNMPLGDDGLLSLEALRELPTLSAMHPDAMVTEIVAALDTAMSSMAETIQLLFDSPVTAQFISASRLASKFGDSSILKAHNLPVTRNNVDQFYHFLSSLGKTFGDYVDDRTLDALAILNSFSSLTLCAFGHVARRCDFQTDKFQQILKCAYESAVERENKCWAKTDSFVMASVAWQKSESNPKSSHYNPEHDMAYSRFTKWANDNRNEALRHFTAEALTEAVRAALSRAAERKAVKAAQGEAAGSARENGTGTENVVRPKPPRTPSGTPGSKSGSHIVALVWKCPVTGQMQIFSFKKKYSEPETSPAPDKEALIKAAFAAFAAGLTRTRESLFSFTKMTKDELSALPELMGDTAYQRLISAGFGEAGTGSVHRVYGLPMHDRLEVMGRLNAPSVPDSAKTEFKEVADWPDLVERIQKLPTTKWASVVRRHKLYEAYYGISVDRSSFKPARKVTNVTSVPIFKSPQSNEGVDVPAPSVPHGGVPSNEEPSSEMTPSEFKHAKRALDLERQQLELQKKQFALQIQMTEFEKEMTKFQKHTSQKRNETRPVVDLTQDDTAVKIEPPSQ
jgi:hypothetical protein